MDKLRALIARRKKISSQIPYRNRRIRFIVLFLVSMVVFANMYAFNNPQALQDSIMKELQISQTQFNMLYTIIALPNLVIPFFIGIIIDYVGIRIAFITLTMGTVVFQSIIAYGGAHRQFQTMLLGRMLLGISIESLNVAQTCFVSYWFLGKQLAFSLGLATTIPQLGNALNSYLTPLIYDRTQSLGPPLYASVILCCLSFICALIAAYIDKRADKSDQEKKLRQQTESQYEFSEGQPQSIKLSDLKKLKGVFWLIVILCMFAIAQYIPFLDNVNKLLQVRFCFSQISAGKNIMITYLVTSILGVPLGILVDKIGYKRYLIMIGMSFFMFSHFIMYFFPQCIDSSVQPAWSGVSSGLFLLGFAYCFYANCILPSIPIVVSKKITGTAFGIMLVLENFAMAVCPMIAGQIIQHSQSQIIGYKNSSLFYSILGFIGLFLSLSLFFINKNMKIILDGTSKQKKLKTVQILPYLEYGQAEIGSQMLNNINLKQKLIEQEPVVEAVEEKIKKISKKKQNKQIEIEL